MTPNECVAQVAHELLDAGPMSRAVRRADYLAFCERNFVNGGSVNVFGSGGTNCAIFVRGCLVQAGVLEPAPRPKATAITTWVGVRGFVEDDPATEAIEGSWVPRDELGKDGEAVLPGDVMYWCSTAGRMPIGGGKFYEWSTWPAAADGHVGIVGFDGDGWMHTTYEGGGSNHTCRKSDGPKDIRHSRGRPLRGVWRPNLIAASRK